ncbi:uncharacterized protein DMAD_11224 [Drosophila madeirensis]|uniref:Uncharacterized protein n=1 Tax=Drosophila madeirensis TaxID=30013 RepID=A0AAU9FCL1_DROMD
MFGLLSSSQIYGLQPAPNAADHHTTEEHSKSNSLPHKKGATAATQHRRSTSSLSDTGGKFFAHLSGKSPSQFIEKFIKSELLNGYDNLKCHQSGGKSAAATSPTESPSSTPLYSNLQTSSDWGGFSCLQGSYRSHGDGEFYEAVQVKTSSTQQQPQTQPQPQSCGSNEVNMRSKGTSSTILLQHYQKLPEPTLEPTFNTQAAGHTPAYKKLSFGSRLQKQIVEQNSDNSHTSSRNARSSGSGSGSEVQRSSSGSSSSGAIPPATAAVSSPERMQRRRLLQMISNYDQQNKQLHRDLAKEKRRRTEELACVVKSLICFESKLKNDMKVVNQRLVDRDTEICRLMRQNRALRKRLEDQQPDEGIADHDSDECLVLEALQCQNCRKQFYDIEVTASGTQTCSKELQGVGGKAEPGSSSDDTVSSSFYGARRSVRYTSKRTAGTFRDYMRSRAMHIDDAALEQQSEENTSSISREDSQTSYEQLHNYSRAMERMHGVKPTSMEDGEYSEQSSLELEQQQQQQQRRRNSSSSRSSNSNSRSSKTTTPQLLEEDDGIFSPTQDDEDFDELDPEQEQQMMSRGALKIVQRRCADFSEASPKQIYETTTDDWYASASDQEETASTARVSTVKQPYGHGAVNPVLECVNQILLQQSMEETLREPTPKSAMAGAASNLPRRSSLSGRSVSNGRKRVHFSTKNSMVHVPRHDDHEEEEHEQEEQESHPMSASMISHYHPMTSAYESIYSNEYEPIGSERASNLYVDMAAAADTGAGASASSGNASKQLPQQKLPPALPPKPANLLKFKKSLHQLEESLEDEAALLEDDCATVSEPDYCSISEVGMSASVRVQIVADVHKAPECATTPPAVEPAQMVNPEVDSDDNQSHKTEEIEEIFADIPKLPNVAAIIAPKQSASEYLMMTPKRQELLLQLPLQPSPLQSQYKRKHVPNILAEINKRMSLPSSPTTPTTPKTLHNSTPVSKSLLQLADAASDLPLQAEFDWYNLDAEYDRSQEVTSTSKSPQTEGMLEEISEDNECLINADADEYNLDEEYQQEEDYHQEEDLRMQPEMEEEQEEGSLPQLKPQPQPQPHLSPAKATQMKKNLASFEKFIEGSGLSTKPLPSKRKIYFNAPFV